MHDLDFLLIAKTDLCAFYDGKLLFNPIAGQRLQPFLHIPLVQPDKTASPPATINTNNNR
jgi:hypothetical protein